MEMNILGQAIVNVTWAGQNGELPDPVSHDATDRDILQWVTEAVRTGGIPGTVTTASAAGDGGASPVTANDAAAAATQSIATTVRRGNRCCIEHPVIGEGRIIAQIACRADHWRLVALRIASIVCAMMISTPNWPSSAVARRGSP